MKQISPEKYIHGVNSIYEEQPEYQEGHDGSDGKCDCIGMPRGALEREGVTGVTNMRGTNQAARKTIRDLRKISSEKELSLGDVVLKVRDKDDPKMRLPDRYRKGGADYSEKWGETNFTHIGTVTGLNPLEITHMTSPTARKDKKLSGWTYSGYLPWVSADADIPDEPQLVTVWADSGSTVKMRKRPSLSCRLYWNVPVGSLVELLEYGDEWSMIQWSSHTGYMMSKFLIIDEIPLYTVTIPGVTASQADALIAQYPNAIKTEERRG